MKNTFKIIVSVLLIVGGVFMANRFGSCSNSTYKEYSSNDPAFNIKMDYISDWQYREIQGANGSFSQVQFYGAVQDGFAPSFVVTVEPSSKVTFKPSTIQAMAEDLIAKRMRFADGQVISQAESEILGLPAKDIILTYKQPDELRSLNAKLVPFKERVIIFQKDDKFYTVRYVNPLQVFDVFVQDFLHGVKSLSIK